MKKHSFQHYVGGLRFNTDVALPYFTATDHQTAEQHPLAAAVLRVPGVEAVACTEKYSLMVTKGGVFDPADMEPQILAAVRAWLYPDEYRLVALSSSDLQCLDLILRGDDDWGKRVRQTLGLS